MTIIKDASDLLTENTDEILALSVVNTTIGVVAYQAITAMTITMPLEPAMVVLGYYFIKKLITK